MDQLDSYLALGVEPVPEDGGVAAYWRVNACKWPILARMARDYLAPPATSASSERSFSNGRALIGLFRNSMRPSTVEVSVCLRSWFTSGLVKPDVPMVRDGACGEDPTQAIDVPVDLSDFDALDELECEEDCFTLEPLVSLDWCESWTLTQKSNLKKSESRSFEDWSLPWFRIHEAFKEINLDTGFIVKYCTASVIYSRKHLTNKIRSSGFRPFSRLLCLIVFFISM